MEKVRHSQRPDPELGGNVVETMEPAQSCLLPVKMTQVEPHRFSLRRPVEIASKKHNELVGFDTEVKNKAQIEIAFNSDYHEIGPPARH